MRLEPELSATAIPTSTGANLVAAVDSFGRPYGVGWRARRPPRGLTA